MRLSIVTTMYQSKPYLRAFHERASSAAALVARDYEIVFVNDGSPDDSLQEALALQRQDPHVRVVDLSRNFGHHHAMWAGLRHARGQWVFLIDCDLEEAPEWLDLFADTQGATGSDVVFGVQDRRGGGWADRWGGWAFYKLFNLLCDDPLPANVMTVRLMSRRYVDALLEHQETPLVIAGLWARTGFLQTPVPVHKGHKGRSAYGLGLRAKLFVHALTSFSNKLLQLVFCLGVSLVATALLAAGCLLVSRLCFGADVWGWPAVVVSVWLVGGLGITCQGVQGLYLANIYLEVRRRPTAIVRHVYDKPEEGLHDRLRLPE